MGSNFQNLCCDKVVSDVYFQFFVKSQVSHFQNFNFLYRFEKLLPYSSWLKRGQESMIYNPHPLREFLGGAIARSREDC